MVAPEISLNRIGATYARMSMFDQSLEYFMKSLTIQENIGSKLSIAESCCNIGCICYRIGDYERAMDYCNKSIPILKECNAISALATSYNTLGNIYSDSGEYEKALEYHKRSLKIREQLGEKLRISHSLINMGLILTNLKEYDKSLESYFRALEIEMEIGDRHAFAETLRQIGFLYKLNNQLAEALDYAMQGLAIAEELDAPELKKDCFETISTILEKKGDFHKALEYYKLYAETKDSIFTEESSKKIAEMQTKYETEKKEKEGEIYRLRNVELAEANLAITEAKEIIEKKNKHITNSIEYARRIQQAILPTADKMAAANPEHFVIFLPKDIVSGDFYWFSRIDDKLILAVVDCTGHGVPGAFMSMIGCMLFNVIVNENRITDPALILENMHKEVRFALKQEGAKAESTDGMDVCLCSINGKNNKLTFAGARRPLYLVRGTELTTVAGDKKSIGGRQREEKRVFTDHKIDIRSGDMIYLSSDGFVDQCNAEGRKFGSRRLKELLTEIAGHESARQNEALRVELDRHQDSEEQRDDIALLGVRI